MEECVTRCVMLLVEWGFVTYKSWSALHPFGVWTLGSTTIYSGIRGFGSSWCVTSYPKERRTASRKRVQKNVYFFSLPWFLNNYNQNQLRVAINSCCIRVRYKVFIWGIQIIEWVCYATVGSSYTAQCAQRLKNWFFCFLISCFIVYFFNLYVSQNQ